MYTTVQNFGISKMEEVSYAHQVCILFNPPKIQIHIYKSLFFFLRTQFGTICPSTNVSGKFLDHRAILGR